MSTEQKVNELFLGEVVNAEFLLIDKTGGMEPTLFKHAEALRDFLEGTDCFDCENIMDFTDAFTILDLNYGSKVQNQHGVRRVSVELQPRKVLLK